jgi:uncharacterized damage-inducible protein DinB
MKLGDLLLVILLLVNHDALHRCQLCQDLREVGHVDRRIFYCNNWFGYVNWRMFYCND